MIFILPLFVVALLMLPFVPIFVGKRTGKKMRFSFIFNICAFVGVCALFVIFPSFGVLAADAAEEAVPTVGELSQAFKYLGAGLSVGLASLGGGIAVAGATPAAIGAVSEDPKNFGKSLIFVALGEGFAIYGILIAIMILNA